MRYKYILLEGQVEDLVARYPKLQGVYDEGLLTGMKPAYVLWIAKQEEPPEDIVDLVNKFEKNKQRLTKKDINQYDSSELALELEQFGGDEKKKTFTSSKEEIRSRDTTMMGQFGPWTVVMPHTTESSCYWANKGGQVSWCTARTQSQNLFLSYVGREGGIILYYLLNSLETPENKNYKVSIGFRNGKAVLSGQAGGLTVNSKNEGLTKEDLKKILGEHYENIMSTLTQHAGSIGGEHPAKREMDTLATDPKKLEAKLKTFKDKKASEDFIKIIYDNPNRSQEVLKFILSNNPSDQVLLDVYGKYYNNPENLSAFDQEIIDFGMKNFPCDAIFGAAAVASNSPEHLMRVAEIAVAAPRRHFGYLTYLLKNKYTTDDVLMKLMESSFFIENYHEDFSDFVTKHRATPEILLKLSDEIASRGLDSKHNELGKQFLPSNRVAYSVASHPGASLETLKKYAMSDDYGLRFHVANNTGPVAVQFLPTLARDKEYGIRAAVAKNPNTPLEILLMLSKDDDKGVRRYAKENPNFVDPVKKSKKLEHRIFERLLREAMRQRAW